MGIHHMLQPFCHPPAGRIQGLLLKGHHAVVSEVQLCGCAISNIFAHVAVRTSVLGTGSFIISEGFFSFPLCWFLMIHTRFHSYFFHTDF